MLTVKNMIGEEITCEICGEKVDDWYNIWHPLASWKGVWFRCCEICLDEMGVNL